MQKLTAELVAEEDRLEAELQADYHARLVDHYKYKQVCVDSEQIQVNEQAIKSLSNTFIFINNKIRPSVIVKKVKDFGSGSHKEAWLNLHECRAVVEKAIADKKIPPDSKMLFPISGDLVSFETQAAIAGSYLDDLLRYAKLLEKIKHPEEKQLWGDRLKVGISGYCVDEIKARLKDPDRYAKTMASRFGINTQRPTVTVDIEGLKKEWSCLFSLKDKIARIESKQDPSPEPATWARMLRFENENNQLVRMGKPRLSYLQFMEEKYQGLLR